MTLVNITTLTLHSVQTSCFPHFAYSELRSRLVHVIPLKFTVSLHIGPIG